MPVRKKSGNLSYVPCMLAPIFNNLSVKERNKISKYKDFRNKQRKTCHLKTTTVPVIVGALGMIKKGTDKHINKTVGSPNL